jgi:hypothetical protein
MKAIFHFSQAPWLFNDAIIVVSTIIECQAVDGMPIGIWSSIIQFQRLQKTSNFLHFMPISTFAVYLDFCYCFHIQHQWSNRILNNRCIQPTTQKTKQNVLRGLNPRVNDTDRAFSDCRRSRCQFLRIEGVTWSAWWIPYGSNLDFLDQSRYFSFK